MARVCCLIFFTTNVLELEIVREREPEGRGPWWAGYQRPSTEDLPSLPDGRLEPEFSKARDEQTLQNQHLGHAAALHGRKRS
jgi:hypothetical protein